MLLKVHNRLAFGAISELVMDSRDQMLNGSVSLEMGNLSTRKLKHNHQRKKRKEPTYERVLHTASSSHVHSLGKITFFQYQHSGPPTFDSMVFFKSLSFLSCEQFACWWLFLLYI